MLKKLLATAVACVVSQALAAEELAMPENVRCEEVYRDRFVGRWSNCEETVSNVVEVKKTEFVDFDADWTCSWDFSSLTNTSGNTSKIELNESDLYSELSGETLRLPVRPSGILQIGVTGKPGALVLPAQESYSSLNLVFHGRRAGDGKMPVRFEIDGMTNFVTSLSLTTDGNMDWYVLPLTNVADGASIMLGSCVSMTNESVNVNDGRVWLTQVGFAESVVEAHVNTNSVLTKRFAARESTKVTGLEPQSSYLFRVKSVGASGRESAFSPMCEVRTTDERKPADFLIRIR